MYKYIILYAPSNVAATRRRKQLAEIDIHIIRRCMFIEACLVRAMIVE